MSNIKAVITGDVVSASDKNRKQILALLKDAFATVTLQFPDVKFEIYRGDGFQSIIDAPENALLIALYLRAILIKGNKDVCADARVAVGLGPVEFPEEKPSESDGKALRLSGPLLDSMHINERIKLISIWPELNEEFEIHCQVIDHLTIDWSKEQAEAICGLIEKKTQTEIASILKVSQPAVHNRIKTSAWTLVHKIELRFRKIVKYLLID
ncbi:MAG: hypothetical protein ACFCUU_13290 [Cyclobacteriaceae bacterium]